MTLKSTQSIANADNRDYKVGKFLLRAHRSCDEARTHLGLSQREIELLMWIASGLTKRDIAQRMGVSPSTADTFRRRAYAKLGVGSSAAAIAILTAFLSGTRVTEIRSEPSA